MVQTRTKAAVEGGRSYLTKSLFGVQLEVFGITIDGCLPRHAWWEIGYVLKYVGRTNARELHLMSWRRFSWKVRL